MGTCHSPAADQPGLFELVDLLPALVLPNNILGRQEAALRHGTALQALAIHADWTTEREGRWQETCLGAPARAWKPAICGPRQTGGGTTSCEPLIISADLRCDHYNARCACVGALLYRHLCTCGHVDEPRCSENGAAEDAMDHAWVGWRELPVLAASMPAENKSRARWLETALDLYSAGWIEAGGPVRTSRSGCGTRHVPDRTPFGGYDLACVTQA